MKEVLLTNLTGVLTILSVSMANAVTLDFRVTTNGWFRCEEINETTNVIYSDSVFLENGNTIEFVSLSDRERNSFGLGEDVDYVVWPDPTSLQPGEKQIDTVSFDKLFPADNNLEEYLDFRWIVGTSNSESITVAKSGRAKNTILPVLGRFDDKETIRLALVFSENGEPELAFLIFNGENESMSIETFKARLNVLDILENGDTIVDRILLGDIVTTNHELTEKSVLEIKTSFSMLSSKSKKNIFETFGSKSKLTLRWTFGHCEAMLPLWLGPFDGEGFSGNSPNK